MMGLGSMKWILGFTLLMIITSAFAQVKEQVKENKPLILHPPIDKPPKATAPIPKARPHLTNRDLPPNPPPNGGDGLCSDDLAGCGK